MLRVEDLYATVTPERVPRLDEHRRAVILLGLGTFRQLEPLLDVDPADRDDLDAMLWLADQYADNGLEQHYELAMEFAHGARDEHVRLHRDGLDDFDFTPMPMASWVFTMAECIAFPGNSVAAVWATVRLLLDIYLDQVRGARQSPQGEWLALSDPTTRPVLDQLVEILNDDSASDLTSPTLLAPARPMPARLGPEATWRLPADEEFEDFYSARFSWEDIVRSLIDVQRGPGESQRVDAHIHRLLDGNDRLRQITWAAATPQFRYDNNHDPLYGLTRLVDLCIGGVLIPDEERERLIAAGIEREAIPARGLITWLADWLGAATPLVANYQPFFHEIVSVEEDPDPAALVTIVEQVWPVLMLGPMLLARGGVRVRAGARVMTEQAAVSPLLFCWWRPNREAMDLSHGWGSNSQWRTEFRRDFLTDFEFRYDACTAPPPGGYNNVSPDLIRHRHATTTPLPREELDDALWGGPLTDPR